MNSLENREKEYKKHDTNAHTCAERKKEQTFFNWIKTPTSIYVYRVYGGEV